MEFCPECSFMLYTKLVGSTEVPVTKKRNLVKYCKNCGYTGNKIVNHKDKCVYKRLYDNNYIVDRIQKNKYTIFDSTLPVLAIDCINDSCITNTDLDNMTDSIIIIDNLPEYYTETDIKTLIRSTEVNTFIDTSFNSLRVKLTSLVLKSLPGKKDELKAKINTILIKSGEHNETLHAIDYSSDFYKKEVIYIKYDPDNMKYMYICRNCSESWLGNN
tara:strand:- start:316 stop:963 length:648 start_codon:yes stop_codon:yes gene_type:complete